jgi:signal transduction histidine kinase
MAGLAKFDRDSGEIIYYAHDPSDPDSLSDDYVLSLLEDSSGNLWVGTRNGLNRFVPEDETFARFLLEDGIPDSVVYGILEDDDGNLWISTNRGISRFSPATGTFHNFDTGDGLQALEFNVNAYYRDDTGEMFFGGVNGYNHFYPDDITDNPYVPPIIVSNFQIQNQMVQHGEDSRIDKPISQLDSIVLDRGDTSIAFELASLHFSSPLDNQFAYIMEGFDEEWNYIGNRRYATYTNLPPGDYTFRAIGTNSDGVWNLDGTSIEVSMPFPFWRTWWFLLLVAFFLAATIYGAFRLRIRSTEARTRELEQQVATRTSEVEKRREIAEGLREILIILNSSRSLEESLHYIVDQAANLTDAEDAIIFRQQQPDQMTIVATNQGGQIRYTPGAALLAISKNWIGDGLPQLEPLIMADLGAYWVDHPEVQSAALAVHKALLGVPLHLGEEVYGGLLMFYTAKRTFSLDDLELGSTFADQAALAVANDRLRMQAEETAVASERNRLARDLHDAVTQTLFSASLIAETLPLIYDNNEEEGRNLLQELRQLTRGALAEMRTLLLELRPMALEESELPDLLLQLSEAVTGRTGIPIDANIERPCKLPMPVRIALYRIAQEALNNVMKHARASKVDLILNGCSDSEVVTLSILDNGRGYDTDHVPSDRMGLKIISERAQAIGADLEVTSQPGQGTRVYVYWRGSIDSDQNLSDD